MCRFPLIAVVCYRCGRPTIVSSVSSDSDGCVDDAVQVDGLDGSRSVSVDVLVTASVVQKTNIKKSTTISELVQGGKLTTTDLFIVTHV